VLDRTETDARCRRAAWLRASVVAAGVLVLFCMSLAWRVAVRAAARARLLEAEARHFRDLSQAAAGLAHETRNPLGLIRGWTQRLAQSGLQSLEQEQQLEAIVEECDRVTSRISQFLTFARPAEPKPESVHLREVLDELALLLEPDLDAKNLKLVYTKITAIETLRADRELLRQALFNLIQNAVQASHDGDTIEITVGRGHDGGRRILVADHGSGVAKDAVESLFTPYFTTRADGTGLGLAIVRRIAGAHGWEVAYTRRSGGGSVFCLDRIHV
jgi:signal transduction histidine kinase